MSGIATILTMAMTLQLPTVEPTAVERTAIRSRNAIKSGVITLRCSHVGPLGKPVTTAYEFQFDGSNRFMEIADEGRPELYPQTAAPRKTRYVRTPTQFMMHAQFINPAGVRFPAYVDDLQLFKIQRNAMPDLAKQSLEALEHATPFDARLIGFVPSSIGAWYRDQLDMFIGGPRIGEATTESEALDGINTTKVTFRSEIDCEITAWICEGRDSCPVRIDIKAPPDPDGTRLTDSMTAQLEQFDDASDEVDGKRWFPRKIIQTRAILGGTQRKVIETEEITVLTASFNKPIDGSQFTLKALNLPESTRIVYRP